MKDSQVTFDFGNMTSEDMARVVKEFGDRGYAKLDLSEVVPSANYLSQAFFEFVRDTLTQLGFLNAVGIANPRYGVALEVDADHPENSLPELWNARARDWAVVESPYAYAVTFQTLMEHFRTKGKGHKETVLSLGSGPGLYETYLAALTSMEGSASDLRLICIDFSKEMTRRHREILKAARYKMPGSETIRRVRNVEPMTGDMMDLKIASNSIDQIICNNSLQWVFDWKKAVAEMARVMNPEHGGYLYLFVHLHPMSVYDSDGKPVLQLGGFSMEELLDTLEEKGFRIEHIRQIAGRQGLGQFGSDINRLFVRARFLPHGEYVPWRELRRRASVRGYNVTR